MKFIAISAVAGTLAVASGAASAATPPTTTPPVTTVVEIAERFAETAAAVAAAPPTTTPVSTTTSAALEVADPLFPLTIGSNSSAVAVVQQRLSIAVDCDYGDQTSRTVSDWQTERGDLAVTGDIGPADWRLLDVPLAWGEDANGDGLIAPSEVTIDCADPAFPVEPVFHEDWPTTDTGLAAQMCAIGTELTDDPVAFYNPSDDTITISGAGGDDFGAAGDGVFDSLICALGWVSPPQYVITQVSSTRALDGMQSATWDGLLGTVNAMWTYHPDQGMNMTIWTTA